MTFFAFCDIITSNVSYYFIHYYDLYQCYSIVNGKDQKMSKSLFFEQYFPKQDDYKMTKELSPFFKNIVMSMQGFTTEEQLKEHLDDVVANGNLHVFFKIVAKEFNEYLKCDLEFDFSTWYNKNHLEFSRHENQIFMSTSSIATMLCYYSFILYQADYMDNADIKRKCFQNIFGIIKDSCLWDCEQVDLKAFTIVLEEIAPKGNYLSLASVLVNTSICFAWLHEMSHCYLEHNSNSLEIELAADKLAYEVFLYIIEKNKYDRFDGGIYTSSFQEYAYLAPAMFISFMHAIKLVEKILYDKTINSVVYNMLIARKNAIIDYIEESSVDIDTEEGNGLYGAYELSLDSFARALVATEKDGLLEKYKNGGWELIAAQQTLKRKYIRKEQQGFIDDLSKLFEIECEPIPQNFLGITISSTEPLTGNTIKISNIKFSLPELLKDIFILTAQFQAQSALSYMLIVVELISTIYKKAKKYLSETECAILLTLKHLLDTTNKPVPEEMLKEYTQKDYPSTTDDNFYKGMSKLLHLDCIEVVEGNVNLKEIIYIRYDF